MFQFETKKTGISRFVFLRYHYCVGKFFFPELEFRHIANGDDGFAIKTNFKVRFEFFDVLVSRS